MGKALVKTPRSLAPLSALVLMDGGKPEGHEWKTWVLEGDAVWRDGWTVITVPEGFMTDFASIPFFARWWQTGSVGPQRIASYFHDWLYSSQSELNRRKSDQVFRDIMKEVVRDGWRFKFRRNVMYLALRIGGYPAWRSNQKKLKELGPRWRMLDQ